MPIQGALNHETVTVAGTAIGITATASEGVLPHAALITVEAAQISATVDGTTPTATVGHLIEVGDSITLTDRGEVMRFLAIRTGGTSATLKVTPGAQYIS